jgi:hypothetical protein
MKNRFYFELILGLIGFIAVLIFGMPGFAVFALFAIYPLITKKKADEREYQLFYKTGNMTAIITFLVCIGIYLASDITVNGNKIGDNWLFFVCFSFLIVHGISGIVVFKNQ